MLPPRGLRERKNAEAKLALYNAAMELFREKGFEKTSVDEIAERAGFSRATFFNHFGAKQGILRYYGQGIKDLVEEIVAKADPAKSPLELIREVIFSMAREAEEHREEVRIIYSHGIREPDYLLDPTPARKRVFEILIELVAAGQRMEQIRRDLPARELAVHILSLYQGVVPAAMAGPGNTGPLLDSAWRFISGGIKSEDSSAR